MSDDKLFHISENGSIEIFHPRPSPSKLKGINGDVVFGISGRLLHNYLLPRDCPRVTYYATSKTTQQDKEKFLQTPAAFVVAIETKWLKAIQQTTLYCYEFDNTTFVIADECAGYYVSYEAIRPINIKRIDNILDELLKRSNVEIRILSNLWPLAESVIKSTLNFSLIRMRNASAILS